MVHPFLMIQLDELILKRFRNHTDRTINFKPGVNGIIGVNGSGKSSVIEAIDFVFTGQVSGTKEELINVDSSVGSSYVKAKFTLNDKPGEIERHLDSSKVILRYDDKVYNKASEVKELWAKLLQIDAHIFKHVIIAHQKKIPELFAGDSSVREKAFQKIFLVPNTEKLRTTISTNYINTVPPALPEEDVQELQAKIRDITNKLQPLEHKLNVLSTAVLSQQQLVSVLNSIEMYKKCIKDAELKPTLELRKVDLESKMVLLSAKESELLSKLEPIDIVALTQRQRELLHQQALHSIKVQRGNELLKAKANFNWTDELVEQVSQNLNQARRTEELHLIELTQCKMEITSIENELATFRDIKGHDKCPTCQQALTNVANFVSELEEKLSFRYKNLTTLTAQYRIDQNNTESFVNTLNKYEAAKQRIENLEKELKNYEAIDFSHQELETIDLTINNYRANAKELDDLRRVIGALELDDAVLTNQLSSLAIYNGTCTAAEELSMMNEVVLVNQQRHQELQEVNFNIMSLNVELTNLNKRVNESLAHHEKNLRRENYLTKLKSIYDMLHTNQFPRKLIQTYSSMVEEELLINIQRFNIPYTPRIAEGFKIEMVNSDDKIIPKLSGGQEMIVGICLRLALHSMFSQSFPMLIIDEGTTHLDVENANLYLNCVKELRRSKTIKQLIIIDHNPALADVVDNVIQIKKD